MREPQKICLITGATSGIGKMTAYELSSANAALVLVGRNATAGDAMVAQLRERGTRAEFVRADLSKPDDVRMLAARVRSGHDKLDVLINNAGARFDRYQETAEGVELTFATNHLGHFLLAAMLADLMLNAPAARVITVASGSHRAAAIENGWYQQRATYNRRLAYANSKLANIMFAYELARRVAHTRITSNAVDPGGVATNFARNNGLVPWAKYLLAHALAHDLASPRRAAATLAHLAVSDDVVGLTGRMFRDRREIRSSTASYDRDEAQRLWHLSEHLMNLPAVYPCAS